ncbi:hypothetical protein BU24DRAFT_492878 [Aaosphaeria arxii CBS 175.79]|uniref:Methyltransferase domain-containing protein n=1 Tax=Aaosphaeria arxii CBS 175.79 TaxID=1450172 RepID=A0A6A5XN57_9PLEO|nr:uncharacterized protein BU24DRAFT_492878 [Aaosphaeria arxii CBS 175.79]KAF2014180.1 hypothetical protein BU24DRAFT_492878 [Aaosphaeria arxii CBS 175.79]
MAEPPPTVPFDADAFIQKWSQSNGAYIPSPGKSFRQCIIEAFDLPSDDKWVYRAQGETTLDITQRAIDAKRRNGMHNWYHDEDGKPIEPPHPEPSEITAYTSLFHPDVSLPKALKAFKASAKANTIRAQVSTHLESKHHNSLTSAGLLPTKKKEPRQHVNPYLDLWVYSCEELEWAGPIPTTTYTKQSHHILPHLYHHFGCLVPTYTALHIISKLAQPLKPSLHPSATPILDIGSGTGYWTYMLRTFLPSTPVDASWRTNTVVAIDSGASAYRTMWIGDTVRQDGAAYLRAREGGRGCILLLVYPQATGAFTASVLRAYEGDVVVVGGTQNGNGFTGFTGESVEEWMSRERRGEFELGVRVPLPSFAGKDEALCVFVRRGSRWSSSA